METLDLFLSIYNFNNVLNNCCDKQFHLRSACSENHAADCLANYFPADVEIFSDKQFIRIFLKRLVGGILSYSLLQLMVLPLLKIKMMNGIFFFLTCDLRQI